MRELREMEFAGPRSYRPGSGWIIAVGKRSAAALLNFRHASHSKRRASGRKLHMSGNYRFTISIRETLVRVREVEESLMYLDG